MPIDKLTIERFTAFEKAEFEFSRGVNVLIGENGTGKSHVLKLLYVLHEVTHRVWNPKFGNPHLERELEAYLTGVFQPDTIGRLVRRAGPTAQKKTARVTACFGAATTSFELTHKGRLTAKSPSDPNEDRAWTDADAVFVPTRELLTVFPGFISAWEQRELSFDRTYYELCKLLDRRALKGPRTGTRKALLEKLEAALGGDVYLDRGYFYVNLPDGKMEAPLLAEGVRKLAMLAYLVINGALSERGLLLWDEPEASMNPKMAPLLARVAFDLADEGVQVVLATHDYVLSSELGLEADRRAARKGDRDAKSPPAAFFGIELDESHRGVRIVERAESLGALNTNPILAAMARLHAREIAFANSES